MRHAKTEGNNPAGDHARELLPRGVQSAQEAGKTLAGLVFLLVLTQVFAAGGLIAWNKRKRAQQGR